MGSVKYAEKYFLHITLDTLCRKKIENYDVFKNSNFSTLSEYQLRVLF